MMRLTKSPRGMCRAPDSPMNEREQHGTMSKSNSERETTPVRSAPAMDDGG